VFPGGIGLRDPRSQKRDLGHPSISPFNIAEGTSFVIPRICFSRAERNEGKRRSYPPLTFASVTTSELPGRHATPCRPASRNLARQSPPHR
jgi:hypothetical protein